MALSLTLHQPVVTEGYPQPPQITVPARECFSNLVGRPALFIDTDGVLPLENFIDYSAVMLPIPKAELHGLTDQLLA